MSPQPRRNQPGDSSATRDVSAAIDEVDRLAEEFVERIRRGERPSVAEYVARHPDHAERIERIFPALLAMEQIASECSANETVPTSRDRQVGPYRIIRLLGHGGMGVVYLAEHCELKRQVALKILPPGIANDPDYLKRFHREASAAARLHHTNIVPVYEVGAADQTHFFAMQYIPGQSLDRVLDEVRELRRSPAHHAPARQESSDGSATHEQTERASDTVVLPGHVDLSSATHGGTKYWPAIAKIGAQTADALEYAHRHGVLHRDIKPSNLMLDENGTTWITDFGLAKLSVDDATATQGVVGTLRFMAPERFQGKADARSDVFSLGLTLYELATLRPAFAERDHLRLIRQITHQDPAPPRQLEPTIPRDLETIILTAIAKEPASRYRSAAALRDDLLRFVDIRPIRARPVSAVQRGIRWCRRNPAVAWLGGCLLIALTCGLLSVTALWLRAEQSRRRADANLAEAHSVVNDFFLQVAESEPLRQTPGTQELREQLLKKAQTYYQSFLDETASDRLGFRHAAACYFLGRIQDDLGNIAAAEQSLQQALDSLDKLASSAAVTSAEIEALRADVRQIMGVLRFNSQRRPSEARAEFQAAASIRRQLREADPENPEHEHKLAFLRMNLGVVFVSLGDLEAAIEAFQEAIAIWDRLTQSDAACLEYPSNASSARSKLAHVFKSLGRREEMLLTAEQAVTVQRELVRRQAKTSYRSELANSLYLLGDAYVVCQRFRESLEVLHEAEVIYAALIEENPRVPQFRNERGGVLRDQGNVYAKLGNGQRAVQRLRQALDVMNNLVQAYPEDTGYAEGLALTLVALASRQEEHGDFAAAKASYDQLIGIRLSLVEQNPNPDRREALAGSYMSYGCMARDAADYSTAVQYQRLAINEFQALVAANPDNVRLHVFLAGCKVNLAHALGCLKDYDASIEAVLAAETELEAVLQRYPEHRTATQFLSNARNVEAWARDWRAWQLATAEHESDREGEKAVADARRACELVPDNWILLTTLAAAFAASEQFEAAAETQRAAVELAPHEHHAALKSWLAEFAQGNSIGHARKLAEHE